jgi:hypothetical protein
VYLNIGSSTAFAKALFFLLNINFHYAKTFDKIVAPLDASYDILSEQSVSEEC